MAQSGAALKAAVTFQSVVGTLSLTTSHHLSWIPSSSTTAVPPFELSALTDVKGLSVSKAGSAKCILLISLKSPHNATGLAADMPKVLLTFTAPANDAVAIREKFKEQIAAAVRTGQAAAQAADAPTSASASATPQPQSVTTNTTSAASKSAAAAAARSKEIKLRIKVLKANPELFELHREVVTRSKEVDDADFWAHPPRAALLRAQRALDAQKAGRNARIADPRPQANERGELDFSVTPAIIRDMFEQHPVVARAYNENVPDKMNDVSFWTRYFKSRLYHRLRTSARSAASEHINADDEIFDRYLEDEDDGIEPRKPHNAHDTLLDLAATEEDHGETGNTKDYTMRAGHERSALPLLRRFNEHSQSLLDSALGSQDAGPGGSKRRVVGGVGEEYDFKSKSGHEAAPDRYYNSIVIDDLEEQQKVKAVPLDVREQQSAFDGGAANGKKRGRAEITDEDLRELLETMRQTVNESGSWAYDDLGSFEIAPDSSGAIGGKAAMTRMLAQLRQKADSRARAKVTFTDAVQKEVAACQAATNEFLRQFWLAVAPQAESALKDVATSAGNDSTSAALKRREKAQHMVKMLRKTDERIESVALAAQEAETDGTGGDRVRDAFRHTKQAVSNALQLAAQMPA